MRVHVGVDVVVEVLLELLVEARLQAGGDQVVPHGLLVLGRALGRVGGVQLGGL